MPPTFTYLTHSRSLSDYNTLKRTNTQAGAFFRSSITATQALPPIPIPAQHKHRNSPPTSLLHSGGAVVAGNSSQNARMPLQEIQQGYGDSGDRAAAQALLRISSSNDDDRDANPHPVAPCRQDSPPLSPSRVRNKPASSFDAPEPFAKQHKMLEAGNENSRLEMVSTTTAMSWSASGVSPSVTATPSLSMTWSPSRSQSTQSTLATPPGAEDLDAFTQHRGLSSSQSPEDTPNGKSRFTSEQVCSPVLPRTRMESKTDELLAQQLDDALCDAAVPQDGDVRSSPERFSAEHLNNSVRVYATRSTSSSSLSSLSGWKGALRPAVALKNTAEAASVHAGRVLQGLGLYRSITSGAVPTMSSTTEFSTSTMIPLPISMADLPPPSTASSVEMSKKRMVLMGVRTSLTHPLNISPVIPPELLPMYGQMLLGGVTTAATSGWSSSSASSTASLTMAMDKGNLDTSAAAAVFASQGKSSPTKIATSPKRPRSPLGKSRRINVSVEDDPCEDVGIDEVPVSRRSSTANRLKKPFVLPPSADLHRLTGNDASAALFELALPVSKKLADAPENVTPLKLGNLVLTSCPGKKVRVTEAHLEALGIPLVCRPTGSDAPLDPRFAGLAQQQQILRAPICRDIKEDFEQAIAVADIKAVVCCIDDTELRFLGATWSEYSRVAERELGLEIIRLPMAEGYAPSSPDVLDAHLSRIICKYTLKGHNVLVHCRGGVGRAGLFACGWMLKLGLLGPLPTYNRVLYGEEGRTLNEEIHLLEKVIDVIRRRRSAKAIETPQQVHFLLKYILWLATEGKQCDASRVLADAGS